MESLGGIPGNYMDGVFFTEQPGNAFRIQNSELRIKIKRQNATLPDVKRELARRVQKVGGNALVGFTYGQKKTFFTWDEVAWYGAGYPARIAG